MAYRLKHGLALITALATVLSGCGMLPAAPPSISAHRAQQASTHSQAHRSDRVIVRFRSGTSSSQIQALQRQSGLRTLGSIPQLGLSVLAVPKGQSLPNALSTLAGHPDIELAEPDYLLKTSLAPSDPGLARQYGHQKIQAQRAWSRGLGDPRVIVAVVDTGIDLTHPDLRDRLVGGRSFVAGTSGPSDDNGHGTHVAGIIAASANGAGIVGVAPNCRLMPVKVLDAKGQGSTSGIVAGIVWAAENGARILNLSLGGAGGGKALESAIAYAQRRGCVMVAAMGNDGKNKQEYPAAYPGVISVAATNEGDGVADFSNNGKWVSVAAPGEGIYSTMPTYSTTLMDHEAGADENYGTLSGTSMATPYVAGVAALLLSAYPTATPAAIKAMIERSADDLGVRGYDAYTGYGRLNAWRALSLPPTLNPAPRRGQEL